MVGALACIRSNNFSYGETYPSVGAAVVDRRVVGMDEKRESPLEYDAPSYDVVVVPFGSPRPAPSPPCDLVSENNRNTRTLLLRAVDATTALAEQGTLVGRTTMKRDNTIREQTKAPPPLILLLLCGLILRKIGNTGRGCSEC